MMFDSEPRDGTTHVGGEGAAIETKGVVYTKKWVVELMLDLAGYTEDRDLAGMVAIEPAAGTGAFLVEMAERLVKSCRRHGRCLEHASGALLAFELDAKSAAEARVLVLDSLIRLGVDESAAAALAAGWIHEGDYLREAARQQDGLFDEHKLPAADFVIGNPPYVRTEDIPDGVAAFYRALYPTMVGRADIYVGFYEAALRQLKTNGVCAFICADRWMLNQYGAELRRLITSEYAVELIFEMHNADAFHDDVSAYPSITIIRKARQNEVVVARMTRPMTQYVSRDIVTALARGQSSGTDAVAVATVKTWFTGTDPWPCDSPERLALLRRIEDRFPTLENEDGSTKVGIGVATGADAIFITRDSSLVEESRLLPLALAEDTLSGSLKWSGRYLVNPWTEDGLVNIEAYPRLKRYLEQHQSALRKRHTAQKAKAAWFKTIDRVNHLLTPRHKLYIPDIQDAFNPVLDRGETYPHHNLYFIQSEAWDLEVLGGLLLSRVAQFFIEAYGVRMRGGYFRFQAQYLRRIRVPRPERITSQQQRALREAFQTRNRQLATAVALSLYELEGADLQSLQ